MVKIMAVYDEDALYARRLAEYVNRRETIPFTAMAFSNLERLKEYGDSHEIEILLVGETVKAAADEVKAGLKMVLCGGEFSIGKEEPSILSLIHILDLLKRQKIQDPKIAAYLEVLDQKSQRLKTLTEDLVEASKASSGNLKLEVSDINLVELVQQTNGEFEERFALRRLELIQTLPEEIIMIRADGRRLWRVLENLYTNAFKYAQEGSRVYVDVREEGDKAVFTIKNISEKPLNISPDELTERFVRGDVARTTEGSGLGPVSYTHLDVYKRQVSYC